MSVRALRRGTMAGRGAAPPAAAPTFRVAAANGAHLSGTASITIPASVVTGDLMVFSVSTIDATTAGLPTGWTLLREDVSTGSGTNSRQKIFYKVAVAGDTGGAATVSSTLSASNRWTAVFGAWSGATQVALHGAGVSTANGTALATPSISPASACEVVEIFAAAANSGTVPTLSALPTTTRVQSGTPNGGSGYYIRQALCSQTQEAAGATGIKTATSSATGAWVAAILALAA